LASEERYKVMYTKKSDVWSIGIIVYEMFTSQPPFISTKTDSAEKKADIYEKIING
jgi:serine/threonine protein kinase